MDLSSIDFQALGKEVEAWWTNESIIHPDGDEIFQKYNIDWNKHQSEIFTILIELGFKLNDADLNTIPERCGNGQ